MACILLSLDQLHTAERKKEPLECNQENQKEKRPEISKSKR
jgi:hypothetical protein